MPRDEDSWKPQDDENDEVEEEEVDGTQYQTMKDAILFAIHVSPSMLSTHEDDEDEDDDEDYSKRKKRRKTKERPVSAVKTALQCAYDVLQQRIISNPNDMMGILLFGTEDTKFPDGNAYKHCYLLLDLDIPDAAGVKTLKKLIEDDEEFNKLMIPSKEPVLMSNVLFGANQIFTTKASNFQSRRLFIVTDEDDPHSNDKAMKNAAITRARDLYDLGIRIDPFYISNPGKPEFDPSKFYEDIIYRSREEEDENEENDYNNTTAFHLKPTSDGKLRLQEMKSSIRSKATPKRALFTGKLEIGPGLEIGIKGYILYKKQEKARSHYVYMGGEQPQLVRGVTQQLSEEAGREIQKVEIKKAYKFGGEQVLFSPEEIKQIRYFGDPVTRIIGFKPRSSLRFMDNIKPATFIYPSESEFVGSTRTFAALHKKLIESDKIGIAWHIPRRNSSPILVAIYPSEEKFDNHNNERTTTQIHPPGFFLIQIPFANDIRSNPEMISSKSPDNLIDSMRKVVKQLFMPRGYIPEKYNNPSLQWHYRILQAIALDEDIPDKPEDNTLPKYKLIDKHAGPQVVEWGMELDRVMREREVEIGLDTQQVKGSSSRGRKRITTDEEEDGGGASSSTKRVRKEAGGGGGGGVPDDMEMKMAYSKGSLNKYTVANLKAWMQSKNINPSGRKQDLVDRIENYFENK